MNALNISGLTGKKQRLTTLIEKAVKNWDMSETLPDLLLMTEDQYNYLKNTRQFGESYEVRTYKAEDRIYHTSMNAMEVRIVSQDENIIA